MRTLHWLVVPAAIALTACGQANAVAPDASNDIDCSVVAFYFMSEAKRTGAPPDQQRASAAVHDWYAKKARAIEANEGAAEILERAGPVLEAVKADPMSMKDEMMSCTNRALSNGLR